MINNNKLQLYKNIKSILGQQQSDAQTAYDIVSIVHETFYNTDRQIASVWDIEDVYSVRPELNHDQAMKVLLHVDYSQDANEGISWITLETAADILYPKNEKRSSKTF